MMKNGFMLFFIVDQITHLLFLVKNPNIIHSFLLCCIHFTSTYLFSSANPNAFMPRIQMHDIFFVWMLLSAAKYFIPVSKQLSFHRFGSSLQTSSSYWKWFHFITQLFCCVFAENVLINSIFVSLFRLEWMIHWIM